MNHIRLHFLSTKNLILLLTYFIQHQNQSLVGSSLHHCLFNLGASATLRIPSIKDFQDHISCFNYLERAKNWRPLCPTLIQPNPTEASPSAALFFLVLSHIRQVTSVFTDLPELFVIRLAGAVFFQQGMFGQLLQIPLLWEEDDYAHGQGDRIKVPLRQIAQNRFS